MQRKKRSKSWPKSSLAVSTTSPVSGSKALNMQNKTVSHILFSGGMLLAFFKCT